MSAREYSSRQIPEYQRLIRDFYEPQLKLIGLARDQIEAQSLEELEISLQKVNDAIANSDSFGKLKITVNSRGSAIIAQSQTEGTIEIGILPLLLERKSQVLDRIKTLQPEQQWSDLREDVAATVNDTEERERLIDLIDRRFEEQRAEREKIDQEQTRLESLRAEAKEREMQLQIQIRERRAAIYRSFLERESVASVVGAILLVALGLTLVVGMFVHVAATDVISNAFLLILGYFFGTAIIHDRRPRS